MKINTNNLISALLLSLFVAFAQTISAINDGTRYAASSRLATGKWIKIKVRENGIYKLSYEDLKQMGFGDPAKVKLFGYGGWMLDENFSNPSSYLDDLPEVAVWANKGSDAVFGSGDYLLFYGRGSTKWKYSAGEFVHENNPYATEGFYFLSEGESGAKEMATQTSIENTQQTFTTFDDYALYERDSLTVANTGRELFGENFVSKYNQKFDFVIPGITSDNGIVSLSFAAKTQSRDKSLTLSIGGKKIIDAKMPTTFEDTYYKGKLFNTSASWIGEKTEKIPVELFYDASGQMVANLNYIRLNVKRNLQVYGASTLFRNKNSANGANKYTISGASGNTIVFDVTDPLGVKKIDTKLSGGQLSFGAQSGAEIHEYALVDLSKNLRVPESLGEVENQNLHAIPQVEMIILAPYSFLLQANLLADEHRKRDGLSVVVVQADWVFNEFSSGTPDATAYRRLMKMFYDRAVTDNTVKPKYLLLFGDGLFDNRFKIPAASKFNRDNYLLTYQVRESLEEIKSYGTDDYFGFLDDHEGVKIQTDGLDLGVGRLPVSSVDQANSIVQKIIKYMDDKTLGAWKNRVTFTADDTDSDESGALFCLHGKQSNDLATYMENTHQEYMLTKVYQDAFKKVLSNGKKTYPDAKKKLMNTLKDGCFLINYTGHGSTTAWTSEDLMTISDINQMAFESLPLWITATCDFGWFDGINGSAAESVLLNKKSGGIALFTTSRVVESLPNYQINEKLIQNIFSSEAGKHLRLGDILRISKNQLRAGDDNKLNYVLLGDPALKLNYPDYQVKLETVNGKPVNEDELVDFKALDKVTLTGSIQFPDGSVDAGFNGEIHTTVFDSEQNLSSVDTDNAGNYFKFKDYPSSVFIGNHDVKNGKFTVTFTVPLDISYEGKKGKMNFYAFSTTGGKDAQGASTNYRLDGTGENPNTDAIGPEIRAMYLNTTEFVNGGDVNETPFFHARVYDKDGINMTGASLGHDISLSIDRLPSMTFNLNQVFNPLDGGEGSIQYSIPTLSAGRHVLYFKIWDLMNNSTEDSLVFNVVPGLKPQLFDLIAAGNPARVNTFFLLTHDRPETLIEVEIKVYDLTGRAVWTHRESGSTNWSKNYSVEWNLCSDNGMRLSPGIYVYRATINTHGGKEGSKAKKIIIQGQ